MFSSPYRHCGWGCVRVYAHTNVCSLHGGYAKVRIVSPLPPLCGFAGTELRSSGLSSKGLGHCVRYVSVAVIKAENQGNLWERSLWFMVPEGMGSPWQGGMTARQQVEAWPQEKGARGSWLQIQSEAVSEQEMAPGLSFQSSPLTTYFLPNLSKQCHQLRIKGSNT